MKKSLVVTSILALGVLLVTGFGCEKKVAQNANTNDTNVQSIAMYPNEQKGPSTGYEVLGRYSITLADDMYYCMQSQGEGEMFLLYGLRFNEACNVNDVFQATIRSSLDTTNGFQLEDSFDKLFGDVYTTEFPGTANSSMVETVRDIPNREYVKMNGRDALKVYFSKTDSLAIVILSKDNVEVAGIEIANARGELHMEEKYNGVINSFEFNEHDIGQ